MCDVCVSQKLELSLRLRGGADESDTGHTAPVLINALGHVGEEYVRNIEIDYEFTNDDGETTTAVTYQLCDACCGAQTSSLMRRTQSKLRRST